MGTDIHCQCEYYKDNKWNWIWKGVSKDVNVDYKANVLNFDRNYDLFAILADVRNGYGFAGVYTGDGFNYISEPKGLPEDMSEELKKAIETERVWLGDHDFSYLTSSE